MKVGLIYQPSGLGDILFIQKIAHLMKNMGYNVYWPVVSEFAWLNDYIPQFNFISWQDEENPLSCPPLPEAVNFPFKKLYSPQLNSFKAEELIFFQGFVNRSPIMSSKYDSVGVDYRDWSKYIIFNRNKEKEKKLFYEVLGLLDGEEYVFVNRLFCTRPRIMYYPKIPVDFEYYGCKVVEMSIIPGYSLFDWCMVIERASKINMIETSLNYLLESPALFDNVKHKPLRLHHRTGSFKEVDYLFTLPWEYYL